MPAHGDEDETPATDSGRRVNTGHVTTVVISPWIQFRDSGSCLNKHILSTFLHSFVTIVSDSVINSLMSHKRTASKMTPESQSQSQGTGTPRPKKTPRVGAPPVSVPAQPSESHLQYGACERNHAQNYSFKVDFWPHLITPPQSGKF